MDAVCTAAARLLVVGALLGLVACAAGSDSGGKNPGGGGQPAQPATAMPAVALPADLRALPVSLERVEYALTGQSVVGEADGDFLSCIDGGQMHFKIWAENELLTPEALAAAARRDLAGQGFALPAEQGLFAGAADGGLYVIAGRVESVAGRYCLHKNLLSTLIVGAAVPSEEFSGEATVEATWEVFSLLDQRVIYSRRISSHAVQKEAMARGYSRAVQAAFLGTLRTLGGDPQLHAALRGSAAASGLGAGAPGGSAPAGGGPLLLASAPLAKGGFAAASDRLLEATVLLAARGHGSGFLISAEGYLLTNAHVVGDLPRIRVEIQPGQAVIGEVLRKDIRRDVALVKVPPVGLRPVVIAPRLPTVGADVYAIGAPLDRALSDSVTKGIVSAIRREPDGLTYIQADVDVQAGSSGGPLTDAAGNVIGMTVLGLQPAGGSIGLNFFIPIADALAALDIQLK